MLQATIVSDYNHVSDLCQLCCQNNLVRHTYSKLASLWWWATEVWLGFGRVQKASFLVVVFWRSGHRQNYFQFPFLRSLIFWVKMKDPHLATPLSLAPWRAFSAVMDWRPSRVFNLALCVASTTTEIQGHSQVCRKKPWGPRILSRTTDANLD